MRITAALSTRGAVGELCIRRVQDFRSTEWPDADLSLRVDARADGSGSFEGWGCIFGVRDTYGTTFQAGCFREGGLDGTPYPLLWMHDGWSPLGTFTAEERTLGLWIAGEYDPTPDGQAARARAQSGSAPELSVGFVWLGDGGEDDPDLITSARLVETSQITLRMASVPGAQLQGVRATPAAALEEAAARTAAQRRAAALLALRLADLEA